MDYVFEDGTKFSGSIEDLEKTATALGRKVTGMTVVPRGYYMSESKGLVKISSMHDFHLRRALASATKKYYAGIYAADESNKEFLRKYSSLDKDPVVADLFAELHKRS